MKKIEANILPLALSVILVLISSVIILTSDYIFTTEHYIGIGCLAISVILYFTNRRIYFIIFALTLTLGLVGLLDFFYSTLKVGFAGVGINPLFLGLMVLFFYFSDGKAHEKNGPTKRVLNEDLTKSFESKFANKTATELNAIVNNDSKFTNESKEAAKRILKKKNDENFDNDTYETALAKI